MGELSFNFVPTTEPQYLAQFKYWFQHSIKYTFAYRRYISLSDTSIFNSPVAITKVATGLSDLYDLFVDKLAHPTIYKELAKNVYKVPYNINTSMDGQSIIKQNRDFKLLDSYDIEKINSSDMSVFHSDINASIHTKSLNICRNINVSPQTNILNEYINTYWGLVENKLYIDKNNELQKINGSNFDIYKDLYNTSITDLLDIYNTQIMLTPFRIGLNIYEDVLLKRPTNSLNILNITFTGRHTLVLNSYDNVYLELPTNKLNIYKQNLVKQKFVNSTTKFPVINLVRPINQSNIIENVFTKPKYHKALNKLDTLLIRKLEKSMLSNSNCFLSPDYLYLDIDSNLFGYKNNPITNIHKDLFGSNLKKTSMVFRLEFSKTSGKTLNILTKDLIASSGLKNILQNKTYGVYHLDKALAYFNIDNFTITEQKYCISLSDVFALNTNKFVNTFEYGFAFKDNKASSVDNNVLANKNDKAMFCDSQVYAFKDNTQIDVSKHISVIHDNKRIFENNYVWLLKEDKYISYFDDYMFGRKDLKEIDYADTVFVKSLGKKVFCKDYVFANKANKNIYTSKHYYAYKSDKDSESMQAIKFISKSRISFVSLDDVSVDKNRKSMIAENWIVSTYKDSLSTVVIESWISHVFKDRKPIEIQQNGFNILKDRLPIDLYDDSIWALKDSYSIDVLYQNFLEKNGHDMEIFETGQRIIKDRISIENFDIDSLFKYYIPANLTDTIIGSGLIIPVSKIEHQGYIDTINNFVHKISHKGYINNQNFASVIPRFVNVPTLDLMCDKEQHRTYLDYKNLQITKQKVHAFIFKDEFVLKEARNTSLYSSITAQKEQRKGFVIDIEKVLKTSNKAFINDTVFVDKTIKLCEIDKQIFTNKKPRDIYINGDLFIEKIPYLCYYSYDVWADKDALKTQLDLQTQVYKKNKNGIILDMTSDISKGDIKTWYDYDVFSNKIIQNSSLANEINEIHKTYKDTGIHPDDFGNWAWVYETPDPFDPVYGIDELLLPENDTQYEQFEDIIFNKKTMRPRNPVKVIDETTFIAKYPTKHPIQKYSDIAVNYDDSAIKVEQYYGIEIDIMHTVFLKYYRIWQSKIFEFSTMTMVQAVKTMLDYLYSWIMEYFPTDKIEQALRVFKLIRWYGESAIIQNSQYIISYEYDTLESKLTTGKCLIPSDMDPDVNNYVANQTMIVDASLGVIKPNPVFLNVSEAHVEFYIKHKKNTSFTFSLSNTVGSVNIYINGNLVDTVSTSKLNLTYQLPYQGNDMTTVRIEKDANSNKSPIFYIGHIVIPNASFKDLSIEFDPVLRAGNKPLDEIAKKIISCANLYDNRDEMYATMTKNNLGLSETYHMMLEYWKLHHQNKTKGKRLTIKQV